MLRRSLIAIALLLASASIAAAQQRNASEDLTNWSDTPLYLGDAEQPLAIHGFVESQFKTQHITPRGLVVADKGVEAQPVGALVFNLYDDGGFINKVSAMFGVWNSVNSSLDIPGAGPWFEIDYFAKLTCVVADRWDLSLQYVAFDSPGGAFSTDNNIEFTASYDDMDAILKDFAIRPYVRFFYNVSGSSTTLLGRNGSTYDAELGLVPTWTWRSIPNYPVTFTLPTYVTVGPANFWGGTDNVGIVTTSLNAAVPLSFIPSRFGHWHANVGISWFDLLNGKLVDASQALGNSRDRSRFVGVVGIGFEF